MALPIDFHLLAQTILYLGVTVAGLVASIPIGVTFSDLGNQCVLYATIDWQSPSYFDVMFGRNSVCNACVSVLVLLSVLYPLGVGIFYAYITYKSRTNKDIGSQMWVIPFMVGTALVTFTIFVISCIVTAGFAHFCKSWDAGKDKGALINGCADVQRADIKFDAYKTENLYDFMTVAESAVWISFVLWILQLVCTVLRFVRNHRMRSVGNNTAQSGNSQSNA